MILAFIYGIFAAALSLFLEVILAIVFDFNIEAIFENITIFLTIFVFLEEAAKFAVIFRVKKYLSNFITSTFFIGFGFFIVEVVLYFFNEYYLNFLSILGIFFIHVSTSIIQGFLIKSKRTSLIFLSLPIAFLLHFAYNVLLIKNASANILLTYFFGLILLVFFLNQTKKGICKI